MIWRQQQYNITIAQSPAVAKLSCYHSVARWRYKKHTQRTVLLAPVWPSFPRVAFSILAHQKSTSKRMMEAVVVTVVMILLLNDSAHRDTQSLRLLE